MSNFFRRREFRRTKKVYALAMEGAATEPLYFAQLKPPRDAAINLVQINNPNHKSKPADVLKRLDAWAKKNGLRSTDEGWILIDRDNWLEADLDAVCATATAQGYHVAMSNPCFELWLWLHLHDNRPFVNRHVCQRNLGAVLVGYEKGAYDAESLVASADKAIERAKKLDANPHLPWPKTQCTRVYRLVEKLLPHVE